MELGEIANLSGTAAMAAGMIPTPEAEEYLTNIRWNQGSY
jgi:hypothetical protein